MEERERTLRRLPDGGLDFAGRRVKCVVGAALRVPGRRCRSGKGMNATRLPLYIAHVSRLNDRAATLQVLTSRFAVARAHVSTSDV